MKNQSCDGFPGSVTQSRGSADENTCPRQRGQVVAASSSDRMMVTTGTDAKRRQGKGEEEMEVRYDRGRARAHPTEEENEIEVREARTPVLHRPRRIAPKSGSLAV